MALEAAACQLKARELGYMLRTLYTIQNPITMRSPQLAQQAVLLGSLAPGALENDLDCQEHEEPDSHSESASVHTASVRRA